MSVYVVTGTSRGLGLEITKQLLEDHPTSKVVAAARNPESSKGLKELEARFPDRLTLVTLDITSDASVTAAVDTINKLFPDGVDYLFNNAGISGSPNKTPEALLDVFNTNVVGNFRVTNALLPAIRKGKGKAILNVTSLAGSNAAQSFVHTFFESSTGNLWYAYRVSKSALNTLTLVLAKDYGREGIKFITVHPGIVETDMYIETGGYYDEPGKKDPLKTSLYDSAKGQINVIHTATLEDNGKFVNWANEKLDW